MRSAVAKAGLSWRSRLAYTIPDEDAVHVGQQPMQNTFPKMPEDRTVRRGRHSADQTLTGRVLTCPNPCKRDSSPKG